MTKGNPTVPRDDDPFLHLRVSGDRVHSSGTASCRLGHPPTDDGSALGPFATWAFDGERLEVRNDPLGLYPIYYVGSGTEVAVSSSIAQLVRLGAPSEFDDIGLALFFRLGFFVGEDTAFCSIRALPPDARLVWQPGHLEVSSQWRATRQEVPDTRMETVEEYARLFRRAVHRRLPGDLPFAVPLSGGADSRHILLELLASGARPLACVTARYYPPRPDCDVEPAAGLAKAAHIPHVVVDQPPSRLQQMLRYFDRTNFSTFTPSLFVLAVGDYLRDRVQIAYDGLGGDVLSAGHFLSEEWLRFLADGDLPRLADDLLTVFSGHSEDFLRSALTPAALARFPREAALARLVAEIERHLVASRPLRSFIFFNRTRRDIALMPTRLYQGVPLVHTPYVDADLFRFLISLPASIVTDHTFHRDTIAYAHPKWAQHPYAAQAPDHHDRTHYRRFTGEAIRYLLPGLGAPFVRNSYLVPRITRCVFDPAYSPSIAWFGPFFLYLSALERLSAR